MENAFTFIARRDRRQSFINNFFSGFTGILTTISNQKTRAANHEMMASAKLASDWIQLGGDVKHCVLKTINDSRKTEETSEENETMFRTRVFSHSRQERLSALEQDRLKDCLAEIPSDTYVVIIGRDGVTTLTAEDIPGEQQHERRQDRTRKSPKRKKG